MPGWTKGAPPNIDSYLQRVEPQRRAALQTLRSQILAAVPGAQECISYSMPAFRVQGRVVAGFLATKAGCSYFPFSGSTLATLARALTRYSQTKSALHFDPARGLPTPLVRQLLEARLAEFPPTRATRKAASTNTKAKAKVRAKAKAGAKTKTARKPLV